LIEAELKISLLPAADEPSHLAPACQQELRGFEQAFLDEGFPIAAKRALAKMAGGPFLSGEFVLNLAATIGPVLGAAVGAWLHARYSRKVRLKVGEIEAEAQTVEEVEKLLARALEIQQRNEPKMIHEP